MNNNNDDNNDNNNNERKEIVTYGYPLNYDLNYPENIECENPITTLEECRTAAFYIRDNHEGNPAPLTNDTPIVDFPVWDNILATHSSDGTNKCFNRDGRSVLPIQLKNAQLLFNPDGLEQKSDSSTINYPPICKFITYE